MENLKGAEQALHGMGRGHLLLRHLHHRPVAFLPLQLIEIAHVPASTVQKEVQELQEQILYRDSFDTLLDARKLAQQQSHNADGLHILDEKGQPTPAGQGIVGHFQLINPATGGFRHALISWNPELDSQGSLYIRDLLNST